MSQPCRCDRCQPDAPAPTYADGFKLQCLARFVADLPSLESRRAWLEKWQEKHGEAATLQIKNALMAEWKTRHSA